MRDCLQRGRVLIVGAGGLGAPAALHLAAAGVGTLGLIDADVVELSNLHRQIIYRASDLGQPKVVAAANRISAQYPATVLRCFPLRLSTANASAILGDFDFVIDATDGVDSKYVVNDGAVSSRVPFSHAGVVGLQGQTMTVIPGESACLRCLFPSPPPLDDMPTCQEAGVIGSLTGSIGLLQATEALKCLLGVGTLLTDRLLTHDAATGRWRAIPLSRRRDCALCGEQPTIRPLEAARAACH